MSDGDDRVSFRPPPAGCMQLVFHRGVKARDTTGFACDGDTGPMEWAAPDRAIVQLTDSADMQTIAGRRA